MTESFTRGLKSGALIPIEWEQLFQNIPRPIGLDHETGKSVRVVSVEATSITLHPIERKRGEPND